MIHESAHVAVAIERPARDVYEFVVDARDLPAWAAGLADGEVEAHDGAWVVSSPLGAVSVVFAPDNPYGVADHDVTLPNGDVVNNPLRIAPNGDGCDVVFTVHRLPGTSAEQFATDVAAVRADLDRLASLLGGPDA